MYITTLLDIVESLPELRVLLLNVEQDYLDDQLSFALLGKDRIWSGTQEGLYRLLQLTYEDEVKFNPGDEIVYPSILRDGDRPGYMVLFLSPDNVVISSFDDDNYTLPLDQALQLIDERVNNGFLENHGSSYNNVMISRLNSVEIGLSDVMGIIAQAYMELIRITNTQSVEYIRGYIENNVTDKSMIDELRQVKDDNLRTNILSLTVNRFAKMNTKIRVMA